MDERSVILNAIKNKEVDIVPIEDDDAIARLVKYKKRSESFREKSCTQWANVDFLRYLDYMLKDFGVVRHVGNTQRDSDQLNQIYDLMAKSMHSKMNNLVLRDYIDWWCSIWAPRLTGTGLWLSNLKQLHLIQRFLSRYEPEDVTEQSDVKEEEIYNLGGLSMLLMKKGIVDSYVWITERTSNPRQDIQQELERFNGDVLAQIMELTIRNSPYSGERLDFVSLASKSLHKHGLVTFIHLNYKECFSA